MDTGENLLKNIPYIQRRNSTPTSSSRVVKVDWKCLHLLYLVWVWAWRNTRFIAVVWEGLRKWECEQCDWQHDEEKLLDVLTLKETNAKSKVEFIYNWLCYRKCLRLQTEEQEWNFLNCRGKGIQEELEVGGNKKFVTVRSVLGYISMINGRRKQYPM